ncbi:hypothetical protein ACXJJ3_20225 [Kribbella sp. WER1]
MDYEAFRAEYEPVFDVLGAKALPDWLPAAIAHLKELAATIDDPADRRSAEFDIADIESIAAEDSTGEPSSPAMMAAMRVYSDAAANHGTPAERIARLEVGMAEIGRISDTAPPTERAPLLGLNESLYMLVLSLQSESR